MIPRISSLQTLPDYRLAVAFDHGARVIYDVKEDMHLPNYHLLRDIAGFFQQAQLDQSRTVVYWNDEIDLPSDAILEYGMKLDSEDAFCAELYENYQNDSDKGNFVKIEHAAASLGVEL